MENNYYIYFHINPLFNKVFYVGKGKGKRAWSKTSRSDYWKHTVKKYNYVIDIVEDGLTEDEAFQRETFYIQKIGRDKLCNMTDGGEGCSGWHPTNETRKKISESLKGFKHSEETIKKFKNKKISEETRKKLSEVHKGRKHTEEYKLRMSLLHMGKKPTTKGKKMSDETKIKISEANKGRIINEEWRKKLSEAAKIRWEIKRQKTIN